MIGAIEIVSCFMNEVRNMDRKSELKQQYKEMKTEAGVYLIRNSKNGKVLVETASNLRMLTRIKLGLEACDHRNPKLLAELREFGKDAFELEVLETLEVKVDGYFDLKFELKKLEEKWLEKLQPFDESGYNTRKPGK